MRVLLFTILNCVACDKHRKATTALTKELNISLNIYNIDDPRYLHMSLKSMMQFNIRKTPSIVLLNEEGHTIATFQGIAHSLEKLEKKIHEERNSN